MEDTKPWWQSTTIITLAISALIKILVVAGLEAGVATRYATDIVTYGLPLVGVLFDAFAAWRRAKATKAIGAPSPDKSAPPETQTGVS
ncbi:MAG TPA: hypothetical protein VJ890_21265 [Vineibacter sp.]|nr:hypothetical protein [Vineibacter sp.]